MEIKVICPCGAKYQFPVEPVDGHLPCSIACPVCGADNTHLGNEALRQKLPPAPTVAAAPSRPPIGLVLASSSRGAPAGFSDSEPVAVADAPTQPQRYQPAPRNAGSSALGTAKKIGSLVLTIGLVTFGVYALYTKWSKRIGGVTNLISAVTGDSTESSLGKELKWTLPDDDAAVLMVKHSNLTNVAQAYAAVHAAVKKQPLKIVVASESDTPGPGEENCLYAVFAPNRDVVEISPEDFEWAEQDAAALAAALSKQLNTYVVMALMGDDAESGVVSIFENGERRFRMKRTYRITSLSEEGIKEFMERDGDAWAAQHGYVPGPTNVLSGDTEAIAFEDVNELVRKLGIDTSDAPEHTGTVLLLKP